MEKENNRYGKKIDEIFLNFYNQQDFKDVLHYSAKSAQFESGILGNDWHERYNFWKEKLQTNMINCAVAIYSEQPNLKEDINVYFSMKSLKAGIIKDLYFKPNETIDEVVLENDEEIEEWE